ncbi:naphthalene 1,2-dioxygenase system ferredoxin subunit [Tistlia consotensis]|uniref:Naphthalene 1,2-dioxygenase system ferredoxin subunit n=1 Tax=Tistlia consotensis USBA 355 TaxID=560819 RepID=A0A1Y6B905_9PROT|nr:non-heme iron oxygenase ferredoxin subunit [Tistlia consotensis]SME88084.1 naphthalene 1,2-dioxygenase system ferredoxin subunit [Tistlia consotensis USBA 355]SNR24446.1 naphthalene 1,2-dioxygenase system ferredoxin subunit [Tistlia consotensis]
MGWHRVANAGDVAEGAVIEVEVGNQQVALYRVAGELFATDNICTHAFACLHEGYLEGHTIECPLHQGIFDIRSGEPLEGPVDEPLRTFPVKTEGDDVLIEI